MKDLNNRSLNYTHQNEANQRYKDKEAHKDPAAVRPTHDEAIWGSQVWHVHELEDDDLHDASNDQTFGNDSEDFEGQEGLDEFEATRENR